MASMGRLGTESIDRRETTRPRHITSTPNHSSSSRRPLSSLSRSLPPLRTRLFWVYIQFYFVFVASNTFYGSLWPIIHRKHVFDTTPLLRASNEFQRDFCSTLIYHCGIVERVLNLLGIQDNVRYELVAGGWAGRTYPTLAYTMTIEDENETAPPLVLTNALGYVFSQGSVFLLNANATSSLDFDTNYVVLTFQNSPTPTERMNQLYQAVRRVDPNVGGYTQYGNSYLSILDDQTTNIESFVQAHVQAAHQMNVTYAPMNATTGKPSLYSGSAAFPSNDWSRHFQGDGYLAGIPLEYRNELSTIRQRVLYLTQQVVDSIAKDPSITGNQSVAASQPQQVLLNLCSVSEETSCSSIVCRENVALIVIVAGIVSVLLLVVGGAMAWIRKRRQQGHSSFIALSVVQDSPVLPVAALD